YMTSLMEDTSRGALDPIFKALLSGASAFYRLGIIMVEAGYYSGIRKKLSADVPVISVGNITLGGTGKTPFTLFTADRLLSAGKHPAVLTRGYGGDENRMICQQQPDMPVVIDRDRRRGARTATAHGADVLLMDDGFQHRTLTRDLDIVLVDAVKVFGNGKLVPRGTLREPPSALRRADLVVLTKADMAGKPQTEKAEEAVRAAAGDKPFVHASHEPVCLKDGRGDRYGLSDLKDNRLLLVSGIADPAYFHYMIRSLGGKVVRTVEYDDHHHYTRQDTDHLGRICDQDNIDLIVTTAKDNVKLQMIDTERIDEKLRIVDISIKITKGEENFVAGLDTVLHS
ncbi:MAG: tetraacyldisaccharide 4'-kinase, partial [Candidatus Omnitrophica bacterium]|nr:tetraacyldisaccharide 4'-kinase [Candidatus Omnitrophota bacterium]